MHLEDYVFETFLQQHANQLESSAVPKQFWYSVYKKITEQNFDIGTKVSLLKIEYEEDDYREYPSFNLQTIGSVEIDEPEHIFLIDHAWTFRVEHMHEHLLQNASLRQRMANIVDIKTENENKSTENIVDEIIERIWRYANYYTIGNAAIVEDRMPVWYIMDEVGCSITHSNSPNIRIVPFYYIPEGMAYSLLFPVQDIAPDTIITRDFVESITNAKLRDASLLPWIDKCYLHESFDHTNVDNSYYLSGHTEELLPEQLGEVKDIETRPCKVFTEYEFVETYLTDIDFEIVADEDEADVLWYTKHFKNFKDLRINTLVNQFPYEYVLTIKDLLALTCRIKNGSNFTNGTLISNPKWLPTTYNLKTELIQFISYFQRRQKLHLDNHWIIKPFNLARSLDTHITNNLNQIIRLATTGSKVVQKYIETPVTFYRDELTAHVKFDIRYVIALRSVKPLQVYVYKNFFLRFANKEFALNNFHVYEQHFTVMNYKTPSTLKHMKCDEFVQKWNDRFDDSWSIIQSRIYNMLRSVFECATTAAPPRGIAAFGQSRAVYAVDLMLEQSTSEGGEIEPKLLEINWTPDCQRACEYYPDFYNDIFKLLFLAEENSDVFDKL